MSSGLPTKTSTTSTLIATVDSLDWMDNKITIQQDISALQGNIADGVGSGDQPPVLSERDWDTLDEPISETLMRDVRGIAVKLKHILVPVSSADIYRNVLKNWDLWGPLILCTFISLTLHHYEEHSNGLTVVGPHFAEIFVLIWMGTYLVSLNFKLLSSSSRRRHQEKSSIFSSPSMFQLLCVFGYCLAPPCLGIVFLKLVAGILSLQIKNLLYERLLIGLAFGFIWPTLSSVKILAKYQDKEKRWLAIYPIALFYFVLSWVIITSH